MTISGSTIYKIYTGMKKKWDMSLKKYGWFGRDKQVCSGNNSSTLFSLSKSTKGSIKRKERVTPNTTCGNYLYMSL